MRKDIRIDFHPNIHPDYIAHFTINSLSKITGTIIFIILLITIITCVYALPPMWFSAILCHNKASNETKIRKIVNIIHNLALRLNQTYVQLISFVLLNFQHSTNFEICTEILSIADKATGMKMLTYRSSFELFVRVHIYACMRNENTICAIQHLNTYKYGCFARLFQSKCWHLFWLSTLMAQILLAIECRSS